MSYTLKNKGFNLKDPWPYPGPFSSKRSSFLEARKHHRASGLHLCDSGASTWVLFAAGGTPPWWCSVVPGFCSAAGG